MQSARVFMRCVRSHHLAPSSHRVAASAQVLCAIADVLSFSLSHVIPSIFLGQICTAIFCLATLVSAFASSCAQSDVIPSTSFFVLARERLGARVPLLPALIGVVISAACIPLNSSAALVSCTCFCGLLCFLFGFPAAVDPQLKLVTKGVERRALCFCSRLDELSAPLMSSFRWCSVRASAAFQLMAVAFLRNRSIYFGAAGVRLCHLCHISCSYLCLSIILRFPMVLQGTLCALFLLLHGGCFLKR